MKSKNIVLGITLARSGSKSIPNKNIKMLGKIPLIGWVGNAASESKKLTEIIISTDSLQYQEIAEAYGIKSYFLRPRHLSSDKASSLLALQHAVGEYESINSCKVSFIVEMMCTNINKSGELIDRVIGLLSAGHESVITVSQVEENHPCRLKTINEQGFLEDVWQEPLEARRQDLKPPVFIRNGNIYAMSRKFLMEENLRYCPKRSYAVVQDGHQVNLDTMLDWQVAEEIISGSH